MKDLEWDQRMLGAFKALACLTEDEDQVLEDWAHGKSIANTSVMHHMSTSKINRTRRLLRRKYDRIQPYTDLPKRNTSL